MSNPIERHGAGADSDQPVSFTRLAYGVGGVAGGIVSAGLSSFVMLYYNRVLGVPAGLVGTALAIALIFDGISDPLVGYASDKFRSRWGRRHPFMYFAILPLTVLVYLIWNPPHESLDPQGLFIYLICIAVPLRLILTFFEVPVNALIPEITDEYDERTRLAIYRVSAAWAANAVLAILLYGYWLRDTPEHPNGILNIAGYEQMGMASAIVIFVGMLLCSIGLHPLIPRLKSPPEGHAWTVRGTLRGLKNTYSEPTLLPLLLGSILTMIAFSGWGSLQPYLFSYFYELSTAQISGLMMAWGVGVVVGFVATPLLSRGRDKRNVAIWIVLALALNQILFPGLRILHLFPLPESALYYPLILLHSTLDMAFYLVLVALLASMMADVAEKRELASGQREEGTIYSAQSFINKSSSALGVWIAGFILELIEFPTSVGTVEVTPETARGLGIACIVLFLVFYPAATLCFSRFRIDRAGHRADLEALQHRPAESGKTNGSA